MQQYTVNGFTRNYDTLTNSENMNDSDLSEYSATSPFVQLLHRDGCIPVLDVLIRRPESSFTPSDIETMTGVDASVAAECLDKLAVIGMVDTTETDDGSTAYQTCKQHDLIQPLAEFHIELISYSDEILNN